ALRNVTAVGGDPARTAILDNFCWGNTERPEVFGSLCAAAMACRDVATAFGTPFISGKDSLNNEFNTGTERIVIPPTLLISALAIVPDVRRSATMDLKEPGDLLVLIGLTHDELGGSQYAEVVGSTGGAVPNVDLELAPRIFAAVHRAISEGLVRACHDLSDGGLAVAAAEAAFAGGVGAHVRLDAVPTTTDLTDESLLFSESNTRFLVEVSRSEWDRFKEIFAGLPFADVGETTASPVVEFVRGGGFILCETLAELKAAWKSPLDW
ncbi:MAG: AIR synthase-related protein, partial [Planctomycetia bacterium]